MRRSGYASCVEERRLAEVLGCLSLGTDITDGFRMEKAMRTAVLAVGLADRAGASEATRTATYWAAVVRFIGCTGFAAEEAHRYSAGDDIALRATLAKVDFGSLRDFAFRALPNIARHAPLPQRISALARLLGSPAAPRQHAVAQCEVGVHLARVLELGDEVTRTLALRDERWDGRGPQRSGEGEQLPEAARIADVADVAELFFCEGGVPAAIAEVKARRGGQLDPRLAKAFIADAAALLAPLSAPSIVDAFLAAEGGAPRMIDRTGLRRVATAYAHVVDLKSLYTPGHSTGTAALVERACAAAKGVSEDEKEIAIVGALLHDVGNLAVPGGLLDKPTALTAWERERVRGHAAHTALVLRAAPCLQSVADVACGVHEYGGGAGYPRATGPGALPLPARIVMAADVYHALREPRAHRAAHDAAAAERIVLELAGTGRLCMAATRAVLEAAGHPVLRRSAPRGLTEREIEVLRLVAIGRTNAEIGALLEMSPRTAQKHVANVYDKLGIASRAAAALFASEHGLLTPV